MNPPKVVLICTGLESGRDGVGDYCVRLSHELIKLGVSCLVLALNDPWIETEVAVPAIPGHPATARIPRSLALEARIERAQAVLAAFEPDWISLQFVAYGFHPKGLPFRERRWLPRLVGGRRLHVMLHETWVPLLHPATREIALVGPLQRHLVIGLLRRLRPTVLHVSNEFFRAMLGRNGIAAEVLPLVSNIPVTSETAGDWLEKAIGPLRGVSLSRDRGRLWLFGIFGGIAPGWAPEAFLGRLWEIALGSGRLPVIVSAGHAGAHAAEQFARWQQQFPKIAFAAIGPRSPTEISQFLNTVDFGLTSYPCYALGKSGSVTAMLEHGLPVITTWGDVAPELRPVAEEFCPLIWRNDAQLAQHLMAPPARLRTPGRAEAIARRLLDRLSAAAAEPGA